MTYSYEERAKNMGHIVEQHKEQTTFEDFASQVFAPVLPPGKLTSKLTCQHVQHLCKICAFYETHLEIQSMIPVNSAWIDRPTLA